jgi:folylpolyglutamate synthase/dihydropteroate synthase
LFPIAAQVVVTKVANPRAATTSELVQAGSRTGTPLHEEQSVGAAMARAREVSQPRGIIVVAGSIFLVGEAMLEMGIPA